MAPGLRSCPGTETSGPLPKFWCSGTIWQRSTSSSPTRGLQGRSGKALSDAVLPALGAKYGEWGFFKDLAPLNIEQMEAELSGKKRIPQ